jgi:hypothetical protein
MCTAEYISVTRYRVQALMKYRNQTSNICANCNYFNSNGCVSPALELLKAVYLIILAFVLVSGGGLIVFGGSRGSLYRVLHDA